MAAYKTRLQPGEEFPSHLVKIYDYMETYIHTRGYPPSVRELTGLEPGNPETYQKGFALSTSVLRYYLSKMQAFGMIQVSPRISRGVRLIPRKQWAKHATEKPKGLQVNLQV